MKLLKYYLEKIKIKPSDVVIESQTTKLISGYFGVPESFFEIKCKKKEITICSRESIIKNELFLNKENILKKLNEVLGQKEERKIIFK